MPNNSTPTLVRLASFDGTTGARPQGPLLLDPAGDIFGTTEAAQASDMDNHGTVFELSKTGPSSYSGPTQLLNLISANDREISPGLVLGRNGQIFGTANSGSVGNAGVVLGVSTANPEIASSTYALFPNDPAETRGGLVADADGNLFGTTDTGGSTGYGAVFEMSWNGTAYSLPTTLASFDGTTAADPHGSLITDQAGDLFGIAASGDPDSDGTVFEIAKTPGGYASSPTVLYSFTSDTGFGSGLVADAAGDLFGATNGTAGIVYEIPKTAQGYGSVLTLANLPASSSPQGPLLVDANGNLFGLLGNGGSDQVGEVFEIPKINGAYPTSPITPAAIYNFTRASGSYYPTGGLAADSSGNLLLVTSGGDYGDIYQLTNSGYQVNMPAPTVTGVTGTAPSRTVGAGRTVTITVNFTVPVTLTPGSGSTPPTLVLNDGGLAAYTGGSGSNALTFSYAVAPGQNTTSLAVTTVQMNDASITDATTSQPADLTGVAARVVGAPLIDTNPPTVSSVTVAPSASDLGAGQAVTLTLNMSEPVVVNTTNGTPTLTLNDGGTATYTGGSGGTSLSFSTTIAPGNNAAALAVTGSALNGASITDPAGNNADLDAAAVTPAGAPQIDTTAPAITGVSAFADSGDVGIGQTVTLMATMTEPVTVDATGGTPTLTLSDGGTATYASGSGTDTLVFNYVVQPGQFSIRAPDGIGSVGTLPTLAVTGASANGGSIADGAGNEADLTSVTQLVVNAPEIDGIAPTVTGVQASAPEAVVGIGQTVTLTVDLTKAVTVTGSPLLHLNDGDDAIYAGGSGTDMLTFMQTVAPGDVTPQLAVTGYSWQNASILDAAGNEADLNGVFGIPTGAPEVDGTTPVVTGISATAPSGDVGIGQTVDVTVSFNKAVDVDTTHGTPALALNDGGSAIYSGGSGTDALTFDYVVQPGQHTLAAPAGTAQVTRPLPWLAVTHVNLNGAVVQDAAGNAADLTAAFGSIQDAPQIDGIAPTVTGVSATAPAGDVGIGQTVTLTVTMSENVTVNGTTGTPTLQLNDGGNAVYAGGSGTAALTFAYTVASGQSTQALAITGTDLGGATIEDAAGNAADFSGAVTTPGDAPQIDGIQPTITAVSTTAPGADLGIGQTVTLTVDFSKTVIVVPAAPSADDPGAIPVLKLNDGGSAIYAGGSGTSALSFTYTVAAGENTSALAIIGAVSNGASVEDSVGNKPAATNGIPAISGAPQIDTTAPTVAGVSADAAGSAVSTGQTVTLTVSLQEAVDVDTANGTPALQLNDGGSATYAGGSGTNALSFTYTVAAGDSTPALAVTGIALNGGAITDGAGNAADLSGAVTTPAGAPAVNIAPSGGDLTLSDTTANTSDTPSGLVYTGPVSGIQHQYIATTSHNLSLVTTTPNWFIHSGPGDDAIDVSHGGGTNVLDGSTGSNFLTGGSGADTFFVDDRAPSADIWSTVNGFHAGDAATLWGVTPGDFALQWADGEGAAGYTGLTLHVTKAGQPTASLTLTGYTQADLANGRLSVSYGQDVSSGLSYTYVHGNG